MSAADSPLSDRTAPVFDWLAVELSPDAELELAAFVRHIEDLTRPEVGKGQLQRCMDLLQARGMQISRMFREKLASTALPLNASFHRSATRLVSAFGKLATGYEDSLNDIRHRTAKNIHQSPQAICAKGLEILGEQFAVAHLAGNSAPYGFWLRAHTLFLGCQTTGNGNNSADAEAAYKFLLTFSAAQPEGLTGAETCWLAALLNSVAGDTSISYTPPGENDLGWFWIDPDQDTPPISDNRRPPPPVEGLIYFSAEELARKATAWIEALEASPPDLNGLPTGLPATEAATLLRRVREYWATPPCREHSRRRNQYAVRVCTGLEGIWKMLRETGAARQEPHTSEWMVVNESPTGYAIMQVTGTASELAAGMALALRRNEDDPWTLCVVRWIRTETPEQVELGLQVIANTAKPVTVGFRSGTQTRPMRPALVLPPIAALGRQQAILAPAGTYSARRFMLVSDTNRLYVAQGRLLSLDMQTSSIELFQYEIDPYPL
ncbi:MAG: hypothetical protein JSS57_03940 [Proteobacteria bacterium]|nr:hypothetical protein [Pseudomonadota bacterium]